MSAHCSSRLVVLALLGALPAVASADEPGAWDQAAVTELATRLTRVVGELWNDLGSDAPGAPDADEERRWRMRDDLRLLKGQCRYLQGELERGLGRANTLPAFQRIDKLRASAAENARTVRASPGLVAKIDEARGILLELAAFYGVEITLPPPIEPAP